MRIHDLIVSPHFMKFLYYGKILNVTKYRNGQGERMLKGCWPTLFLFFKFRREHVFWKKFPEQNQFSPYLKVNKVYIISLTFKTFLLYFTKAYLITGVK